MESTIIIIISSSSSSSSSISIIMSKPSFPHIPYKYARALETLK